MHKVPKRQTRTAVRQVADFTLAHGSHAAGPGRAPYNFVPVGESVLYICDPKSQELNGELPRHDRFETDRLTGHIDLTLTLKSNAFVRGPFTPQQLDRADSENTGAARTADAMAALLKNKPEFFFLTTPSQRVIPGTSLRGMFRNLTEIVTYSKLQWIPDRQYFYRSFGIGKVAKDYREAMRAPNVRAGYLVQNGGSWEIQECNFQPTYVGSEAIKDDYDPPEPPGVPKLPIAESVQFTVATNPLGHTEAILGTGAQGWRVKTGYMNDKSHQYVFSLPKAGAVPVSSEKIKQFNHPDQLTEFQKSVFPQATANRSHDGALASELDIPGIPGEPVFFTVKDGKVEWLGRARFFRLPYEHRVKEFVPEELRQELGIDIAESIFGFTLPYTGKNSGDPVAGDPRRSYASRVHFSAAWETTTTPVQPPVVIPPIMAGPKASAINYYLQQPSGNLDEQVSYNDPPQGNRLRGHKLYFHQAIGGKTVTAAQIGDKGTQYTTMRPAPSGRVFKSRISFENLSRFELGALAWIIEHAHGDYALKIGMGKAHGYGSVQVEGDLKIDDVTERYDRLFDQDGWAEPTHSLSLTALSDEFAASMKAELGLKADFRAQYRIACLLAMLDYRRPHVSNDRPLAPAVAEGLINAAYWPSSDQGDGELKKFGTTILPDPLPREFQMPDETEPSPYLDRNWEGPTLPGRVIEITTAGRVVIQIAAGETRTIPENPADLRVGQRIRFYLREENVNGRNVRSAVFVSFV